MNHITTCFPDSQTIITAVATIIAAVGGGWISGQFVLKGQHMAADIAYKRSCQIVLIEMLENLENLSGQIAVLKMNTDTSIPVNINLDLATDSYFRYEQDIIGGGKLDNFINIRKAVAAIRHAQLLASMLKIGVQFDQKKHKDALINVVKTILEASTLLAGALPRNVSSDITGNILTNARNGLAELESSPHSIVLHVPITESAAWPTWGDVTGA
ncbi:hypothetical protein A6M27_03465 [Acidithiobacillus thiooxidans]|uniref:Uncharacterized protein n=1 Tax=Acidithiobacillus thiooxidans TaxID=930 RepID=A0A1C2JLR2_ACITH|nr:hypothetical protein [Acidithiobacillus thiooxidans]OCX76119.1 hypothetical protein A6P07_03200 [Acidithiobacillus thiooxidans]OCX79089.1 hypothetical protein A6O24_02555 [Acidithiobacillus thiooxidans]OCX84975.1 hypothetical protein A6O26_02710 [Acidithiobacillus thiooxidans]OCX89162.1 hypothetical protein A6M27_03465 [Acidithiobacillus thiooxidans]OFC41575.1 hypothetical protein BAE47_17810 [Acidithiobacillus thiooxidans]